MNLKLSKGEKICENYLDLQGNLRFIITSNQMRDTYYLYEVAEEGYNKLGKAKSPTELRNKFKIIEKLRS